MKIAIRVVAGLVVVGLVWWISSLMTFKEVKVPMPLRGEAARNPFYAAIRLTEELGGEATWERVFTTPPDDAVIFLSAWNWTLGKARRERLEHWVEAGGRLIVDGSMVGGFEEFERWSGVSEQEVKIDEDEESDEEEEESFADMSDEDFENSWRERMCHRLVEDVSERGFKVCGIDYSRTLSSSRKLLWALRDGRDIHALRTAVGRGSVTVINGVPFRYRSFLEGDHPALFIKLLQLRRDDTVLFLSEGDSDSLLRLMWRYGAPAVLLMAAFIALALWRAGARFGPPIPAALPARRSLAEQIRGTGQFALRFGRGEALRAAAVRALEEAARRRFPGFARLSAPDRAAKLAELTRRDAEALTQALLFSGPRRPNELRSAIALLEAARRDL
jgi:hypothetical protein